MTEVTSLPKGPGKWTLPFYKIFFQNNTEKRGESDKVHREQQHCSSRTRKGTSLGTGLIPFGVDRLQGQRCLTLFPCVGSKAHDFQREACRESPVLATSFISLSVPYEVTFWGGVAFRKNIQFGGKLHASSSIATAHRNWLKYTLRVSMLQ